SLSGTGAHPSSYLYGLDADGPYRVEVRLASGGGTNEWTKTSLDPVGRPYKNLFPGASGTASSISYYNARGQRTNQIDPDAVSTIYVFNSKGEQTHTVLDFDQDHVIDYSGDDRITMTTNDVAFENGANVNRTRTYAWATAANTATL